MQITYFHTLALEKHQLILYYLVRVYNLPRIEICLAIFNYFIELESNYADVKKKKL